jgi:MFS family permease
VTLHSLISPLEERPFRLLWLGQTVTAIGDRAAPVGLAFAVLELTRSASALGLVLAAATLPKLVLLLFAGVIADRLPRQHVMIASDLVRGAAQATTAGLLLGGVAEVWEIAALQAVYGVGEAFFLPAATAVVPDSVSRHLLQKANALLSTSRSGSKIVGPAAAGGLVAAFGPGSALAVDAASFVVSAWCLAAARIARRRPLRSAGVAEDLRRGWDEFRSRTWTWVSVAHFSIFQMAGLAPFLVLGPLVSERELGGASAWATILAAAGAGSFVGAVAGLRAEPRRPLFAAFLAVFLWVPQLLLFAVAAPVPLVAAGAFVAACGLALTNIYWYTALQNHIPGETLSRVSAYDNLGSLLLAPIGYAAAGSIAVAVGTGGGLVGAAVTVTVLTLVVLAVPSVRALPRRPEPKLEPADALSRAESESLGEPRPVAR